MGVRVITILGGFIATNMFAGVNFSLPQDSYYTSLHEQLESQAKGSAIKGNNIMTVDDFGKQLMEDVLNGRKGLKYRGTMAWAGRWVGLFPTSFTVSYYSGL